MGLYKFFQYAIKISKVSLILLCFGNLETVAQTTLKGILIGHTDNKPVVHANILLLNAGDSVLSKGTTTNETGYFNLENINPGEYLLHFSSTGFVDSISAPIALNADDRTLDLGTVFLSPIPENLQGVIVVAKKPLYEQRIDRMVINVKASPTNAGNTVLEVLEKSPGIMVNRSSGAISMNGKDGVMVMINGKLNYMPMDAIFQMLNGINATMVDKIELLTVPPSKYDAGGNAGYINIVLQENPNQGFNGNYSLGMGVGRGTYPTASTNFNYRKGKVNIYGNYSFARQAQLQKVNNYRSVIQNGETKEAVVVSARDPYQRNHNARLGIDYSIGKKTVLGSQISGYNNKWYMTAENESIYKTNGHLDTLLIIGNEETNHWKNIGGNLNLQHTFNSGSILSLNTDYLHYTNTNPTEYVNNYYDANNQPLGTEYTFSGKETIIDIWVGQADYSKKLNDKTSVEMGAKIVGSQFTNDVRVSTLVLDVWVDDPKFTANYGLKETIGAGYFSMSHRFGPKTSMQAGLRYEYTNSNLGSETQKNIVDRQYGNLFPTVYLSRQLTEKQSFNLSYNRRINRPTFNQLAPFLIFLDPKTFISGNPAVQPSITDAVKLDYIVNRLVFSASFSYENNTIARFVPETNPNDNTQVLNSQNMDYTKQIYLSATLPTRITKWWFSTLNLTGTIMEIKGTFNKEYTAISQTYFNVGGSQIFTLPKKFTFEASGFFVTKSFLWASSLEPYGVLNLAIQKKFNRNPGILTFGVDNLLNTNIWKTSLNIPGQGITTNSVFDFFPVTFKAGWTQSFGNKSLKENRNRVTGGDDVKKRVE